MLPEVCGVGLLKLHAECILQTEDAARLLLSVACCSDCRICCDLSLPMSPSTWECGSEALYEGEVPLGP
eukprot:6477480-Amphidinium_carterae.2